MPAAGIARQHMRLVARGNIAGVIEAKRGIADHPGIAAMAIGAAKPHGRALMHGRGIARGVAGYAAGAVLRGLFSRQPVAGWRRLGIDPLDRLFAPGGIQLTGWQQQNHAEQREKQGQVTQVPHQKLNTALASTE